MNPIDKVGILMHSDAAWIHYDYAELKTVLK